MSNIIEVFSIESQKGDNVVFLQKPRVALGVECSVSDGTHTFTGKVVEHLPDIPGERVGAHRMKLDPKPSEAVVWDPRRGWISR